MKRRQAPARFQFRTMWAGDQMRALSSRIAENVGAGDFGSFDAVMGVAVNMGMNAVEARDAGVFVGWLVKSVPFPNVGAAEETYETACTNLGLWSYAAGKREGKSGLSRGNKVRFGHTLRAFSEAYIGGDEEAKRRVVEGFVGEQSSDARQNAQIEAAALRIVDTPSRIRLPTEQAHAEVRRQGAGRRAFNEDYTRHRIAAMKTSSVIAGIFENDVRQLIDSRRQARDTRTI